MSLMTRVKAAGNDADRALSPLTPSTTLASLRELVHAELPSENRGKNLLRLDNEFHRIAFLAVGREENYRIQFGQLQHIERMRMLSLHFMGQETNVKDHTGLYQAIAEGDLKTTLERLEVHMGRYRENLAAVQERYPNYFCMS